MNNLSQISEIIPNIRNFETESLDNIANSNENVSFNLNEAEKQKSLKFIITLHYLLKIILVLFSGFEIIFISNLNTISFYGFFSCFTFLLILIFIIFYRKESDEM